MELSKKNILVIYYSQGVYPLRETIYRHLYCWKDFSGNNVFYVNVAFGFPEELIREIHIDVVIFHTIFLSMRWSVELFLEKTALCSYLKTLDCVKIAMPQDEFIRTELLNDFINDFGVTHLLTCAEEKDWRNIYHRIDFDKVQVRTVLTGYVDTFVVKKVSKISGIYRNIDIGYRAWKADYWLGEHGMLKVRIAEIFESAAKKRNLISDISLSEKDVLSGFSWFEFLLRCKAVLGVEGGASVLDRDGSIKAKVENFLRIHPDASFEETRQACFADEDNRLALACLSPRHFEACITKTCQILVEGAFNGILKPDIHYIPVKPDFSNMDEVFSKLRNESYIKVLAENAYRDVIASKRWTYEAFVEEIERDIIEKDGGHSADDQPLSLQLMNLLNEIDDRNWDRIRREVSGEDESAVRLPDSVLMESLAELQNKYEKLEKAFHRIERKVSCRKLDYYSYRELLLEQAAPDVRPVKTDGGRRFLILSDETAVNRRVERQRRMLSSEDWNGTVITLSADEEDEVLERDGFVLHRIGKRKLLSECPLFWRYKNRERMIESTRLFRSILMKLNTIYYKMKCLKAYGSSGEYPLPGEHSLYLAGSVYAADVIIAHHLGTLRAALRLGRLWNKPVIYDMYKPYRENSNLSEQQKDILYAEEAELIGQCSAVWVENSAISDHISKHYGICATVIEDIPSVENEQQIDIPGFHRYFNLDENCLILLYKGFLEPFANLENLVKAMEQVEDKRVVLVLMGDGNFEEVLRGIVLEKGLGKRVKFLSEIKGAAELFAWMKSADSAIVPWNAADGDGIFYRFGDIQELLSAGLLPIVSERFSLKGIAEKNICQMGPMNKPEEIAYLINLFFKNFEKQDEKGKENTECFILPSRLFLKEVNEIYVKHLKNKEMK